MRTPRSRDRGGSPRPRVQPGLGAPSRAAILTVAASLLVFLLTQYRHALDMPFAGDDFLILERVRGASFWDLFAREGARIFGWYRPISREVHYGLLSGAFGVREPAFHAASFALWVAALLALHRYLWGLTGPRAAVIAVAGVACLTAWGYPLMSVAGAQDLWMLLFSFLYLTAVRRERRGWAALWLGLALLSKESAVLFLGLSATIALVVDRLGPRRALRVHLPSLAACALWMALHPTLLVRLSGGVPASLEATSRPPLWAVAARSLLAVVNLEAWPRPAAGWRPALLLGAVAALPVLAIAFSWRVDRGATARQVVAGPGESGASSSPRPDPTVLMACGAWAVLGFAAPALPSLGWHSYYAIIGLIGAWAMLGTLLAQRLPLAAAAIAAMALLRAGQATTPTQDWSDEWFQLQAGNSLRAVRARLLEQHPSFPPHSRIYFTHVGNKAGLVSGRSPALRIWYGDATLKSFHLRDFTARRTDEPAGRDYFFYFDPARGPVEIEPSRDGQPPAQRDAEWEGRHFNLASALFLGGDIESAAREYLAVARGNTARSDCALYAAACFRVLGRVEAAEQAMRLAVAAGMPRAEAASRVERLLAEFPGAGSRSSAPPSSP